MDGGVEILINACNYTVIDELTKLVDAAKAEEGSSLVIGRPRVQRAFWRWRIGRVVVPFKKVKRSRGPEYIYILLF
jgi:hypothetical protein